MRLAALLLLGLMACSKAEASRRLRHTRGGTRSFGGAATNVVEDYTWDWEFWGSDDPTTTWAEHQGQTALDMDYSGLAASLDGDTDACYTAAALPSALVDNFVTPVSASDGYFNGDDAFTIDAGQVHVRILLNSDSLPTDNRLLFQIQGISDSTGFYIDERTGVYRVVVLGGSTYTFSTSVSTGCHLIDLTIDGDGGSGGVADINLYIDGSDTGAPDHSASATFSTGVDFAFPGFADTGNGAHVADYLFFGIRNGGSMPLATHQADASRLGL
jgi:hypothetical protein